MIKAALEYIEKLKEGSMEPIIKEINGKTYCNKDLIRYDQEPMASQIEASTLTALVDYVKHKSEELKDTMIIHVIDSVTVQLYSGLTKERKREYLFSVRERSINAFSFDKWYDQERFLIELQSNFKATEDLETIQRVSGNIEAKTVANYGDDGISQKTTIKQGIATKVDVQVPNPVLLRPYRTFLEIEQPESQFVFRISENNERPVFKLVEAEGGLWKNRAMHDIKCYLESELKDIDNRDRITIIA